MGRKRKFEKQMTTADKYIKGLKFKDLKRECVVRGMPFNDVISGGIPKLTGWLWKNFNENIQHQKLDEFDDWQEQQIKDLLESRGEINDSLFHPSLRLGYIAEKDEEGNTLKRKRVKTIVGKKRNKRERTTNNLFKGTKKAYTFELQQSGLSKEKVVELVKERFPEAIEKSIHIWYNKSRKTTGSN